VLQFGYRDICPQKCNHRESMKSLSVTREGKGWTAATVLWVTTCSDCTAFRMTESHRRSSSEIRFVCLVLVFLSFAMHSPAICLQHLVIISAVTNAGRSCRQLLAICTELCRRKDSGTVHRYTITTQHVEWFRANTSPNILTPRRSAQVKYTDCLTLVLQT
jgi:hypothetical protein